eukprot:3559387-Pleurochrysis_carterae.AAC.3
MRALDAEEPEKGVRIVEELPVLRVPVRHQRAQPLQPRVGDVARRVLHAEVGIKRVVDEKYWSSACSRKVGEGRA